MTDNMPTGHLLNGFEYTLVHNNPDYIVRKKSDVDISGGAPLDCLGAISIQIGQDDKMGQFWVKTIKDFIISQSATDMNVATKKSDVDGDVMGALYNALDKQFDKYKETGKREGLQIDDTQIGAEFAFEFLKPFIIAQSDLKKEVDDLKHDLELYMDINKEILNDPDRCPKRYWLIEQPDLDDDDDYKVIHTTDLDVYPDSIVLGEFIKAKNIEAKFLKNRVIDDTEIQYERPLTENEKQLLGVGIETLLDIYLNKTSDPDMVTIPRKVLEGMVDALKYVVSKADKDGYVYARSEEDPERFTYMDIDDAREAINDVLNYKEGDDE